MMKLQPEQWYWVSHPDGEGMFIPAMARDERYLSMSGEVYDVEDMGGMIIQLAVMPEGDKK